MTLWLWFCLHVLFVYTSKLVGAVPNFHKLLLTMQPHRNVLINLQDRPETTGQITLFFFK